MTLMWGHEAKWTYQCYGLLTKYGTYWEAGRKLDHCLDAATTSGAKHALHNLKRRLRAFWLSSNNPPWYG